MQISVLTSHHIYIGILRIFKMFRISRSEGCEGNADFGTYQPPYLYRDFEDFQDVQD